MELTSIITKASAEHMQLNEGKEVVAIIKSTNIILGTGF
jgi:molybdopterin-binding protein